MPPSQEPIRLSAVSQELVGLQDDVRDFFGWDLAEDMESAQLLLSRVEGSEVETWMRHKRLVTISKLYRRLVIRRSDVLILGAALESEELADALSRPSLLVAADGSSGALSELPGSICDKAWSRLVCVVSDADGGDGTFEAVKRSVPIVLHAHGDNRTEWSKLLEFAETLTDPPDLVLTHQTPELIRGMHNPGGFTDGDRAVSFLLALGVDKNQISLLGTRNDLVGRWSGKTQHSIKMEKLSWMTRFLDVQGFQVNS